MVNHKTYLFDFLLLHHKNKTTLNLSALLFYKNAKLKLKKWYLYVKTSINYALKTVSHETILCKNWLNLLVLYKLYGVLFDIYAIIYIFNVITPLKFFW